MSRLILLITFSSSVNFTSPAYGSCLKTPPPSMKLIKENEKIESYVNESKDLALTVACSLRGSLTDLRTQLGKEVRFNKIGDRIESFEISRDGILTRSYVLSLSKDTMRQFTFVGDVRSAKAFAGLDGMMVKLAR